MTNIACLGVGAFESRGSAYVFTISAGSDPRNAVTGDLKDRQGEAFVFELFPGLR